MTIKDTDSPAIKHVILDTDAGEDPDEVFAILLALASPEIKIDLIVTSDERKGVRAAFVSALMKSLGRTDIEVVRGGEGIRSEKLFVVESMVEKLVASGYTKIPPQEDFVSKIKEVIEANENVHYLCIGPFTNLAAFLMAEPSLSKKLNVIIMGGARAFGAPGEVEHNVRCSISDMYGDDGKPIINAALEVFSSNLNMRWVISDTTFKPDEIGVKEGDETYKMITKLAINGSKAAMLLLNNCDEFFRNPPNGYKEAFDNCTMMHDPLTVSYAIKPDILTFEKIDMAMTDDGVMTDANKAESMACVRKVCISTGAKYTEFMDLMRNRIETLLNKTTEAEENKTHMDKLKSCR